MTKSKSLQVKLSVLFVSMLALLTLSAPPAAQASTIGELCSGANLSFNSDPGSGNRTCSPRGENPESKLSDLVATVVNVFSIIVGIVAVIMIIYGGFRYITSGGDSGSITSAKHTIIYALVGLIIVALAQVIVRFVLNVTDEAVN